jgi:hypothetical protein
MLSQKRSSQCFAFIGLFCPYDPGFGHQKSYKEPALKAPSALETVTQGESIQKHSRCGQARGQRFLWVLRMEKTGVAFSLVAKVTHE